MRYQKGNLFDAPKGSYLVHSCNCMGRWGSGIAAQFQKLFPRSYDEYRWFCNDFHRPQPGDVLVCKPENGYQVVCLFTSRGYGAGVDPPHRIVAATGLALSRMPKDKPVHMPRINSGHFNVPWSRTEELLIDFDVTIWHQA